MSHPLSEFSAASEAIVAALAPTLVGVLSHRMRASGFVWKPGWIVTSDEGLAEERDVEIELSGGGKLKAEVKGRDPSTALALLACEARDDSQVTWASEVPNVGAYALAIGVEAGTPAVASATVAISRGSWQSMRGGNIDARIELDAQPRRSLEGGLAVNAAGQPFGMIVFGPKRRMLVIPAATIARVVPKLEAKGRVPRGYLGLSLQPVTIDGGGEGLLVVSVDLNGPGAAADITQGDILVAWDGKPIERHRALFRALGPDSVGKPANFDVRRGRETRAARVVIGERPAS